MKDYFSAVYDPKSPVWLYVLIRDTGTLFCGPMAHGVAVEAMQLWSFYVALKQADGEDDCDVKRLGNKRFGYDFHDGEGGTVPQAVCYYKDVVGMYTIHVDTSKDEIIKKQRKLLDKSIEQMDELNEGEEWKRKHREEEEEEEENEDED